MINRRHLRVKVFQGLYVFLQTEGADLTKVEKDVFASINRLYDLYLYLIASLIEIRSVAIEFQEQQKAKRLPSAEDLNPNMRFVENRALVQLSENVMIQRLLERAKINWTEEHDDFRRIFKAIREDETFRTYMSQQSDNLAEDKKIVEHIFSNHIAVNEAVIASLEEKDIYWQDDMPLAALTVIKTINKLPNKDTVNASILPDLYKEKQDDQQFVKELFRKTIQFNDEYESMIAGQAKNWESDRIAFLDMLLMKMAVTELEHLPTVPVKVTLNEYIELSKLYSTPKSKHFINGILDKLVVQLQKDDRINKSGRGLRN